MSLVKTKKARILLGLFAALAVTAAAIAYWTASGTGSGNGSVGNDSGITVDNVAVASTLYPGGSSDVNAGLTNKSSDSSVKVGKLVLDTAGITVDSTHKTAGCSAGDFHYTADTLNTTLAASESKAASKVGTVSMDNSTTANQDACKGATITVNLKTDNSGI